MTEKYQLPPGDEHRWVVSRDGVDLVNVVAATAYYAREKGSIWMGIDPLVLRVRLHQSQVTTNQDLPWRSPRRLNQSSGGLAK